MQTIFAKLLRLALFVVGVLVLAWPSRVEADSAIALSPSPSRALTRGSIRFIASGGTGHGYVFSLAAAPSGGTVAADGAYSAGPVGGVVDVVEVVDSSGSTAQARVDVISSLAITAPATSVAIGGALSVVASGGSGAGYTWSLRSGPSGGAITSGGEYRAGLLGDVTDVVVLADSAGNETTLSVRVTSGLELSPSGPHVAPGSTFGFVAAGGSGGAYLYTLTKNASGASLNRFGVYTAGPTAGVVDVVQVRDGYGNTKTANVSVDAIAIAPSTASVSAGTTRAFVASGGSGAAYAWSLASTPSGGTINAFGVYTAGLVAGTTDVVRVVDSSGNVSTARVTVTGPVITPSSASVASLASLGFVAAGGAGGYTWSFAANRSGASLTRFGLYTAGAKAGVTDIVQVEDSRGNTSVTSVSVTGGPTISPAAPSVTIGGAIGFVAADGSGDGYAWSLAARPSGGSITSFGVYTAGPLGGVTDIVEVTDSKGSRSTTTITVTSGLAIHPRRPWSTKATPSASSRREGRGQATNGRSRRTPPGRR